MAVRGVKPKPTKLKLLHGERNKDRINLKEPKPKPVVPKMPSWLNKYAKKEWKRIVPELKSLGLLTQIDRAALSAYCDAYGRWREASEGLQKHGMVWEASSGYLQQTPYVSMVKNALADMMKCLTEFGMTPSSRTRIVVDTEKDDDSFEKLLD